MINFLNNKAKAHIANMVRATLPKIKVKAGVCRYNFRCQINAVHEAIERKEGQIAMSVYIDGTCPVIHFLNVDKKGRFTDNTLGHWSKWNDYFFVKHIDQEDFIDVDSFFAAYRKELRKGLPWYVRLFSDFDA